VAFFFAAGFLFFPLDSGLISLALMAEFPPEPLAAFSVSILDFLVTFGLLGFRAKSTDEAGVASGFCELFYCPPESSSTHRCALLAFPWFASTIGMTLASAFSAD
jgi:hypothetical protein